MQALITWTAILPLVLIVSALVAPFTQGWPDLLRAALTITVVVPIAVFWAVPLLAKTVQRMRGVPRDVVAAACSARLVTASESAAALPRRPHAGPAVGGSESRFSTEGGELNATHRPETSLASGRSEQGR